MKQLPSICITPLIFSVYLIIRYITSDCDAVAIIHDDQGYAKSPEDAVADVLKAGMLKEKDQFVKNETIKSEGSKVKIYKGSLKYPHCNEK